MKLTQLCIFLLSIFAFNGCPPKRFLTISLLMDLSIAEKVVLKEDGPAQFLYWEMADQPFLWTAQTGSTPALRAYRDSLQHILGDSTYRAAVLAQSRQDIPLTEIEHETNGDRYNSLLTHSGEVGKIRPINWLEAQVLNYQLSRYPLLSHPTEFHGFIAKQKDSERLRFYFAASDTPWPPKPYPVVEALEAAAEKGWYLAYHLHNHYEPDSNQYVGVMAPSLADAHYFKMLAERFGVKKTMITNGFHTVEMQPEEFERFRSH